MKILQQKFERTGQGQVKLVMQEADDMWHVYNLVTKGDLVQSTTFRKIKEESKTGSIVTNKRKIIVLLNVQSVDYDPEGPSLRVSGVNIGENKFMNVGQHHTLELTMHVPFTIVKRDWDSLHKERLREATDPNLNCEVAALVMEEGLAHLCLITNTCTVVKSKIEHQVPRKRKGVSGHDKAVEKFFEKCMIAIAQHINFSVVKCLLIASPGYVKDQFTNYLEANKPEWYKRDMVVVGHSSSGEKQALVDTLSEPTVRERLSSVKFSLDLEILEEFFKLLAVDPNRAVYSLTDVKTASDLQAISTLIVSDATLRTKSIADRHKIVDLIQTTRENGGEVRIVSSAHVAGERLQQLSGIAALLRFPVYDLCDTEELTEEEQEAPEEELKFDLETLDLDLE